MTIQRTNLLALLTGALLAMGTATAQAQEEPLTVTIAVPDIAGVKETTDFILPIGQATATTSFGVGCMTANDFDGEHPIQRVVVIDRTNTPTVTMISDIPAILEYELPPGTRLVDLEKVHDDCAVGFIEYDIFEAEIAGPRNADVATVMLPSDSLTENHECVVKSGAAAYDFSKGVAVTKGEKAQHTELIADIDLYAGDRLIDFVELDHDADSGNTWYACWLEY